MEQFTGCGCLEINKETAFSIKIKMYAGVGKEGQEWLPRNGYVSAES